MLSTIKCKSNVITDYPAYLEMYNKFCVPALVKRGFIYVAYNPKLACYKIGLSKVPKLRARRLSVKIIHLITTDDMTKCEKILHWFCEEKRNKRYRGTELFDLEEADLIYLKTIEAYVKGKFIFIETRLFER